jgi:hypothetical protein
VTLSKVGVRQMECSINGGEREGGVKEKVL